MRKSLLLSVIGAAIAGTAVISHASELIYGFSPSDSPNQLDGFASNSGGSLKVATATESNSENGMSITTTAGGFKGALTGSVPSVLDNPAVDAVSVDVNIPSNFDYAGGYADLGITIFCESPSEGEFGVQYQVDPSDEQNIDLAAGTQTTVTIPLTGLDPDTGNDESYGALLTTGATNGEGFIPTGFEFFLDENGANDVLVANVQADFVPEPASLGALACTGGLMLVRRRRKI
jgi:hypothetical protein